MFFYHKLSMLQQCYFQPANCKSHTSYTPNFERIRIVKRLGSFPSWSVRFSLAAFDFLQIHILTKPKPATKRCRNLKTLLKLMKRISFHVSKNILANNLQNFIVRLPKFEWKVICASLCPRSPLRQVPCVAKSTSFTTDFYHTNSRRSPVVSISTSPCIL